MTVCGEAYDGKTALQNIESLQPDIVFTDVRMPGLNGLELIARAKTLVPQCLFVIISGYNEFDYARKALRLGVLDYIDKPVNLEKLDAVLKPVSYTHLAVYQRQVFGAFIFTDPHAQNVFPAVQINADGDIDCLLHDLPFAADMVVDGIQRKTTA